MQRGLVAVAVFHEPGRARSFRQQLTSARVWALLDDEGIIGASPDCIPRRRGLRLQVREEDAGAAPELLGREPGPSESAREMTPSADVGVH